MRSTKNSLSTRFQIHDELLAQLDTLISKYPGEPIQMQIIMRLGKTSIALKYCLEHYLSFAIITKEDISKYEKLIPPERREQVRFYVSPTEVDFAQIQCLVLDDIREEVHAQIQLIYLNALRLPFIPDSHVVKFTYQDAVKNEIRPFLVSLPEKTLPSIMKKIESLNPHDNPVLIICDQTKFKKMQFDPKYRPVFSNSYKTAISLRKNAVLGTNELIQNVSLPQFQFVIIAKKLEDEDLIQAAFRANTWTPWKKESYVFCLDPAQKEKIDAFLKV